MSSSRPSTSRPVPQQQHTGPRSDMNGPRRLQASQELHPVGDGWSNSHVGHRLDSRMAEYHDWTLSTTSAKTSLHRHDYRLEPMPQQPMYHPAFDRAELACMDIVRKIASKIKDIGDAHLAALLASKMHEAGTIHHSIPELVGFFGMTGQGKSTAVGLLLGDKRLIKEGSGGESVTRLPIVYTFRQEPDTSPYEALVTVCDPPTCRDSVKAHVTNVIAELDAGRSLENDQDQISTSKEMLKGLFADVPAFKSDAALRTYLTHSKHDGQDVYKECIAWADERRRAVMRNTHSVLRAADPQALWEQLAPYAGISLGRADEKSLEFDPSSLVARIRISSATRLRLSLGDFPGLGDIDRDRITKAQRQLELCDTIIVAEDVSRAASSDFLLGFLIECYRRRPETHIIVALTKCEKDINVTNRLNTTFDLSQTRDLNYLEERKARAEQHLEAIPSTAYTEEYRRLKFEMKCIDLEQRFIFARERNQRTARKLAARYAERTNGRHLRIFPLSSAAYDTNICGYDQIKVDTLPLSVTASGFPALIYELADIPCARIQRDMRRYTETTLPDLLSFIELCCSTSSTTVSSTSEFKFDDVLTHFEDELKTHLNKFDDVYMTPFFEAISAAIPFWIVAAGDLCKHWATNWHAASHQAFLLRNGCHATKTQPWTNWNKSLLVAVQDTLDPLFAKLLEDVQTFALKLCQQLDGEVEQFIIDVGQAASGIQSAAFDDNLCQKKPQFLGAFRSIEAEMTSFLKNYHGKTTNDGNGEIFTGAMEKVYKEAKSVTVVGDHTFHKASCRAFQQGVCDPEGPFLAIGNGIEGAWRLRKSHTLRVTMRLARKVMEDIKCSYRSLGAAESRPNDIALKARNELLVMVNEGRMELNGPIQDLLNECGLLSKGLQTVS